MQQKTGTQILLIAIIIIITAALIYIFIKGIEIERFSLLNFSIEKNVIK